MLTVEEIERILLDHFDPLRTDGFSVLGGHAAKAAQAIYEAQKADAIDDPWVTITGDVWWNTCYMQVQGGRLYRERIIRKDEGPSVALCFVPGEGCGG